MNSVTHGTADRSTMSARGPRPAAVFFPERIPEATRSHARRRGECRVYDTLKAQLPAPWHVYYSRPWLGLDRDGRDRDGEADFVLAHPDFGMLVLEVKGGGIRYDSKRSQWTTTNGDGDTVRIKDPAVQATTSKHELLKKLRREPGWGSRFINARIGVLFPDCHVPGDLAPNLPRYAVAGVTEMQCLAGWVEQRLVGPEGTPPVSCQALGDDGLTVLDEFFARSFTLERPMAATLLQADTELRILTERQALILQLLEHHRRLAIPGAAGTGKTALAVEKALRLAHAGERTLLLCYNRPLACHLRDQVGAKENLVIASFHAFVAKLGRRAKLDIPQGDTELPRSDGAWGHLLIEALLRLPDERFDAVIVDEGQDLDEGWLPSVEALLRTPNESVLYVFYDDNQKVHRRAASIEASVRRGDVQLNRILRNTRPIAESFRALLPQSIAIDGPDGPPVEFRSIVGSPQSALHDTLADLIRTRRIAADQIAVLFPDRSIREEYVTGGKLGGWPTTDAERMPQGEVISDSVRRFKGLERSVVVIFRPSAYCTEVEVLYVGMSRARTLLVVLDTEEGLRRVAEALQP